MGHHQVLPHSEFVHKLFAANRTVELRWNAALVFEVPPQIRHLSVGVMATFARISSVRIEDAFFVNV